MSDASSRTRAQALTKETAVAQRGDQICRLAMNKNSKPWKEGHHRSSTQRRTGNITSIPSPGPEKGARVRAAGRPEKKNDQRLSVSPKKERSGGSSDGQGEWLRGFKGKEGKGDRRSSTSMSSA